MDESEFQKFAADDVCIRDPAVHALFDFDGLYQLLLDCAPPFCWALVNHLNHLPRLFSIGELLVVELSRPDDSDFLSLVGKETD